MFAVMDLTVVNLVRDQPEIMLKTGRTDRIKGLCVVNRTCWVVWRVDEKRARAFAGFHQLGWVKLEIQLWLGLHKPHLAAHAAHGRGVGRVIGINDDTCIAGIEGGAHGGKKRALPTGGNEDVFRRCGNAGFGDHACREGFAQRRGAGDCGVFGVVVFKALDQRIFDHIIRGGIMIADAQHGDIAPFGLCLARGVKHAPAIILLLFAIDLENAVREFHGLTFLDSSLKPHIAALFASIQ